MRALQKRMSILGTGVSRLFTNLISLLIFAGVIFSIGWLLFAGYIDFFVPKFDPFSITLDSSSFVEMKGRDDCDLFHDFHPANNPYPVKSYSSPESDFSFSSPTKDLKFLLAGTVVGSGALTVARYNEKGERQEFQQGSLVYSGSAAYITVHLDPDNDLPPVYYLCAPELIVSDDHLTYLGWDHPELQKSAAIDAFGPLTLSIRGASSLEGASFSEAASIDITFPAGFSNLEIYVKGKDLQSPFYFNRFTDKFSVESYATRILDPKGELKYGNRQPVKLGALTTLGEESLIIPESTFHYQGHNIPISHKIEAAGSPDGVLEIHGPTDSLILNDVDLGRTTWHNLPGYARAGLFSLLLFILAGLWASRASLWRSTKKLVPFLSKSFTPPPGSAVCVMNSGPVFAGMLVREPTPDSPYFLLRDARRKAKPTEEWEKETIAEIRLRADYVEQFYTL